MRSITIGPGLIAMAALSTIVSTPGVAAADDYAGQKYSDVMSKLGDSDLTGVIATRSGDLVVDDDCVVSSSAKASGNSKASPEGKAAMAAAKEEEQQEQAQAAADTAKAKH